MAVSIIIPSYNRAELLKKTLMSVVNQTSSDWECIVVDDMSTDNTKEIVLSFEQENSQVHYYLNNRKRGAQGARNTGLYHAQYDWVMFFDSDNIMHPDFVKTMLDNQSNGIDVLACCSDILDINSGRTGRIMNPNCNGDVHDELFCGKTYVDFNQAIIRKAKIHEIGDLDENCPSMQEWDTHIRLSKVARYSMIEDVLIDYYMGGKDAITSNSQREVIGRLYILNKHLKEWKQKQMRLTKFSFQIYFFINKNKDEKFKKEKINELKKLVSLLKPRIILCSLWVRIKH
ncbi:MAG: glycosyltransferase family 2 protein [Bacteroidales bacterium]|nr:glycosyltransferase family 2 protein [Bacteroidales bacterium]